MYNAIINLHFTTGSRAINCKSFVILVIKCIGSLEININYSLPHKRIFVDKMEFYIVNMHSNTMTNIKCIEINAMIKETNLLIDFTTVFGFYYCTIL